ncbi:MAG: hypothetical protein KGL39_24335 [Patescibacteria group bacterium]|nr:hypothetical protein [Patescibacteria group bacterium]
MVKMLQANDTFEEREQVVPQFLSEEEIKEALKEYTARGVRIELTKDHWYLTLRKEVRDIKGRVIGAGDCRCQGVREMPVKDLLYSAEQLMIPLAETNPIG